MNLPPEMRKETELVTAPEIKRVRGEDMMQISTPRSYYKHFLTFSEMAKEAAQLGDGLKPDELDEEGEEGELEAVAGGDPDGVRIR